MATAPGFQAGTNQSGGNYFIPVIWDNNFGPSCTPQQDRIYMPYDGIEGFCNVTLTGGSPVNGSSSDVTIVSNDGNGHLRLNITENGGDRTRYLNFSGALPTAMTVVRDGRTGRTPLEWINGVRGQWVRDLDASFANNVPENSNLVRNTLVTPFYQNDVGTGQELPYQVRVDAIAAKLNADANFVGYWSVLGIDLTDAEITAIATYQRDAIPQRGKIALEFGNERWNQQFTAYNRLQKDGVEKGYYGAATASSPQPTISSYYEGGGNAGSLLTTRFCPSGGYVSANVYGVGNAFYQAKQDAPIGTPITGGSPGNPTENAYFTKMNFNMGEASRRWSSVRHNQIIEIYRSVFGETRFQSQIVPVVMDQTGGNLFDKLIIERTFVPGYWAKIKGMGNAGYYGPDQAYDTNTVTAAQLEASFIASYPVRDGYVLEAVRAAAEAGKTPMLYEVLTHTNPGYGAAGNEFTQWNLLFSTAAGRGIVRRIATFFRENVSGVVCAYDGAGRQEWSLMRTFGDTSNPRLLGWEEGIGAAIPPVDPPPIDPPPVDPPPVTLPTIDRGGAILHQYRDVLGCAPVVCLIAVGIGVARAIV